jgi:RNA polymerase sigma-70 factor (ECF subfamily)
MGTVIAMSSQSDDTDELLKRAGRGDPAARQELLTRHRARLRQMVAVRMDARLAARLDPSDVVQESLADAARHLDDYLRDRPLPFYLWLRRLTWERLIEAQRRHVLARRRSVRREEGPVPTSANGSTAALADRLLASGTSPSRHMIRQEQRQKLLDTLASLGERDREVLELRYLEGLSTAEIADVLGISPGAVMTRHTRALARLRSLFDDERSEGDER